ncbi:MAG: flagellar basal body-associated FliL family protein [Alphaproteobacteria bacterium]|nr:flagellar basal body-associated FliL family protein [Alphaproteobacteria bacterium]
MRKILILLVVLLVLGGGGGGAYYVFVMQPAQAAALKDGDTAHGEAKEGEEAEHAEGGGDAHGEKGKSEFVELDPLILPILDNSGVNQVVSLVIAIEVPGPSAKDKVKSMSPKLKDAYIQDMYGMLNEHAAMKGGVVQVAVIKERLNVITKDIMGKDTVKEVLLQVVQQRPI